MDGYCCVGSIADVKDVFVEVGAVLYFPLTNHIVTTLREKDMVSISVPCPK